MRGAATFGRHKGGTVGTADFWLVCVVRHGVPNHLMLHCRRPPEELGRQAIFIFQCWIAAGDAASLVLNLTPMYLTPLIVWCLQFY